MKTTESTLAEIKVLLDAPDDPYLSLKIAHAMGRRIEYCGAGDDYWPQPNPTWHYPAKFYRIAPPEPTWTLPEPPAGRSWHRTDFTEEMLLDGWRPLLKGEIIQAGDQCKHEVDKDGSRSYWGAPSGFHGTTPEDSTTTSASDEFVPSMFYFRTRRPLPAALMPLTASDIQPGDAIRLEGTNKWRLIVQVTDDQVATQTRLFGYDDLLRDNWQIRSIGGNWRRAAK